MGTRSAIGIKESNQINAIYCHFDGYVNHNGRILFQYYKDKPTIKKLLKLGDITALGAYPVTTTQPSFGKKLEGTSYNTECRSLAYDPLYSGLLKDVEFRSMDSVAEFADYFFSKGCEYLYLWENGEWMVSQDGEKWEELDRAIVLDTLVGN